MKAQDRSIPLNVYASHFQSPYTPTLLFLPATWTIRNVAAHVGAKVTYHCKLDIILHTGAHWASADVCSSSLMGCKTQLCAHYSICRELDSTSSHRNRRFDRDITEGWLFSVYQNYLMFSKVVWTIIWSKFLLWRKFLWKVSLGVHYE